MASGLIHRRAILGAPSLLLLARPAIAALPPIQLRTDLGSWTDDFEGILRRRVVRVLVPYSRTLFFQDRGTLYGTTVHAAQLLESWLNKTYKTDRHPIVVGLFPTSREALFDELLAGEGDIAAGDITITEERAQQVAFTRPVLRGVKEILVTRATAPKLPDADALSGAEVAAREGTSTFASLQALNRRLAERGKPPVEIDRVPPALEAEDMMEMVAAGLLPAIVADDWVAKLWATLIPGLALQPQVVLRNNADIAWAVRPNNPKLLDVLNQAIGEVGGTATKLSEQNAVYLRKLKQIHGATSKDDVQRFEQLRSLFNQYGSQYGFDDLLLQAQSYQESRLRQDVRSRVGAVGLMQLMPATGASMKVGDITREGPNVHAGAKYMRQILDKYFPDAHFDEQNRTLFAFASYNAGPSAIARVRKMAEAQGLKPDVWFNNVERVVAARIGQEPVRYVRNIYKYYVAYKLLEDHQGVVNATRQTAAKP